MSNLEARNHSGNIINQRPKGGFSFTPVSSYTNSYASSHPSDTQGRLKVEKGSEGVAG